MPRLNLIDALPLHCPDPVPLLLEKMNGHTSVKVAGKTVLRRDDEADEETLLLQYEGRDLLRLKRDSIVLLLPEFASPSMIARCNAVLSLWGMYIEGRQRDVVFPTERRDAPTILVRDQLNPRLFAFYRREGRNLIFERTEPSTDTLYICEAGGKGVPYTYGFFIPYTVPDHDDETEELEAAHG
jgi:hypothetical protein